MALTVTIGATGERVWRAIVDPSERPLWDDRILGEIKTPRLDTTRRRPLRIARPTTISTTIPTTIPTKIGPTSHAPTGHAPATHPEPIRSTRWRFRWSGIPLVLIDEIHRAEGHDRLYGRISIGSMHVEQTITIAEEFDGSGPHVRLGMKLVASNSIAVIGEVVPRLEVQRLVIEYVDTTLRLVRKHCEADGRSAPGSLLRH